MKAFGRTDKGIVRRDNQDHFQIETLPDGKTVICVVCDGMGGAKAGNVASTMAAETFIGALTDQPMTLRDKTLVKEVIADAAMAANRVVHEMAKASEDYKGMGTTLVGAVLRGGRATIVNVGDSRAYLISGGKMRQITRDHSLVEDMVSRGDITRDEAQHHPNRNLITRVIGTEPRVKRDMFEVELKKGDRLLFCSDGLTNLVSDEDILQEIKTYEDLEKCCEMLITLALAKGGSDNVTALMIQA